VLTIAGAFLVLYRFTPRRRVELADVWPAALVTALAWEGTRRLLAFYMEQNNMISGYGPIGAAMALLFWIYVTSIIILLGAELAYAIAKERRHIGPHEEMLVAAPPGEQPTPKFAHQVGAGFDSPDEVEPIQGVPSEGSPAMAAGRSRDGRDGAPAVVGLAASGAGAARRRRPRRGRGGPLKDLLWAGLNAGIVALTSVVARRLSAGLWQTLLHEPPPTTKA
jgi:hypothetical protein